MYDIDITERELEQMLRAADIVEIQMLHGQYMTYLDQLDFVRIYNELMAKGHPELSYEMVESGEYIAENVENLMFRKFVGTVNEKKDVNRSRGFCGCQYLWSPRIKLNKDATRAWAQWNQMSPHTMDISPYPGNECRRTPYWYIGKYNNEYIKIDGEWKLLKCHVIALSRTPYAEGWIKQSDARRIAHGPQAIPDKPPRFYAYHSDTVYSGHGRYTWGPFLPEDDNF